MALNPYSAYLEERDPVDVLERTYVQLCKLVDRMPEEQIALTPPQGKWSAREIVAHLADCEMVFGFRLRQALAEDAPTLQPFDQERWARRYANHDMQTGLRLFSAARDWNLLVIWEATEAERQRPVTHPERGTMTFWTIVETMAGHDMNHIQQLQRLVEAT